MQSFTTSKEEASKIVVRLGFKEPTDNELRINSFTNDGIRGVMVATDKNNRVNIMYPDSMKPEMEVLMREIRNKTSK